MKAPARRNAPSGSSGQVGELRCKVLLVNMPCHSIRFPSLALSTLKASLLEAGHEAHVANLNIAYAHLMGPSNYEKMLEHQWTGIGEQVFADVMFPERRQNKEFRAFVERSVPFPEFLAQVHLARKFLTEARDMLLACDPDIVGFTTTFYQKMAALALATKLKELRPNIVTVLGGAACELPMGEALLSTFDVIDYVFHGEADKAFPHFVDEVCSDVPDFESVTGVCYRDFNGKTVTRPAAPESIDLDAIPRPDFSDYRRDLKAFGLESTWDWKLSFETSRGCWWGQKSHCTFCGLNGTQMRFRHKSPRKILQDIAAIVSDNGTIPIQFTDNILHMKFFEDVIPGLGKIGAANYFFEVKANLKECHVAALAASRVTEIQPGLERLSDEALRLMRKGTTAGQNVQLLLWCAQYGVRPFWNVIYGFPGETAEAVESEIALISQITHLAPPTCAAPIRLDRYSPNYERAAALGFAVKAPSEAERYLFSEAPRLWDLAYHFDYAYLDDTGSRVGATWEKLVQSVSEWRDTYSPHQLVQRDAGSEICIIDRRQGREHEVVLSGALAMFYRRCGNVTRVRTLQDETRDFERLAQPLRGMGLVIEHEGWLVAGAVRQDGGSKH